MISMTSGASLAHIRPVPACHSGAGRRLLMDSLCLVGLATVTKNGIPMSINGCLEVVAERQDPALPEVDVRTRCGHDVDATCVADQGRRMEVRCCPMRDVGAGG